MSPRSTSGWRTRICASWRIFAFGVRGRTADQHVVSLGRQLREGKCLQATDHRSIDTNKESDVWIAHEALVSRAAVRDWLSRR